MSQLAIITTLQENSKIRSELESDTSQSGRNMLTTLEEEYANIQF